MPGLARTAAILITTALVFYSAGVWAERLKRDLVAWHVGAFWLGFAFDASGTIAMELIHPGFDWASLHTITGQIALWLMLAHAIWATWVLRSGSPRLRHGFHRFSLVVWGIWLVPYVGGMFLGMTPRR